MKCGLTIARLVFVGVCAGLLCAGAASAQRVALQENPAASESKQEAQPPQPQTQPAAGPADPENRASYNPNCDAPEDQPAADFCQQKRMADAADATLRATRNQNDLIGLTLFFAVVATIAAWRSAGAANKTLQGLERPYFIIVPTTTLAFSGRVHTGFRVENHGRAPGTIRLISMGGIEARNEFEAWGRCRFTTHMREQSIFVAEQRPFAAIREITITPLPDTTPPEQIIDAHTYVAGRIIYESVLGMRYERYFCWRYEGRDDFKEIGGSMMNGDRRVPRIVSDIAFWLGFFSGRYLPRSWNTKLDAFTRRQSEKERERQDRPK